MKSQSLNTKNIDKASKKSSGVHKQPNGAIVPAHYHEQQKSIAKVTSKVMRITSRRSR